jgi:Tol biopolymer transport system component
MKRLNSGKPGWPVVLWDIDKGKEIARLITMDNYGYTPIWSQDGTQFIMATKIDSQNPYPPANEFFAVSRDGQVRQLTHFTQQYRKAEIINNYSISPDGSLVAFWVKVDSSEDDDARLAVLDTATGSVTNYCITADPSSRLSGLLIACNYWLLRVNNRMRKQNASSW